jgi:hypothetical protein
METGYLHVSVFSMRFRSRGLPWPKHQPINKYTLRSVQEFVEILTFVATKVLVINKEFSGIKKGVQIVDFRASNLRFNHRPQGLVKKNYHLELRIIRELLKLVDY